ncbi:aKG-HExxH-type peptide beta-hydroxylase [Streptomyces sp. NPDC087850]|uniref:aKG-HExxH-type peptide beta-hydroxylase n=1 Tax=Streptomyces sp. NPDC087850 TaxID=3365809 RepID=UPI0037F2DEF5
MRVDDLTEDESAAGLPDLARIVLPRTPDDVRANERLHRVVARHCLVRFLRAPRRLGDAVPGPAPALALAGETLDALEVDAALDLASRPDLTGWIWRSGVAGADPVVLLAELESCLTRDAGAAVARGVFTAPQARRVSVPVLTRSGPDRGGLLFSWAAESESDERPLDLDASGARAFAARVQAGADVLADSRPLGLAMASVDIRAFAALSNRRGDRPLNFSVHGLRGLVLTSERPGFVLAQPLVHEATHQRFSGVLDCMAVVRNPRARHYSPFVDAERPLGHLLHGVLSFISGLHAARCRRERTADAREQERIGRHLTERAAQPLLTENNLTEVAEPTAEGARLLAGCREAVECLRRG